MNRSRVWFYFLKSAFRSMRSEWRVSLLTMLSISVIGLLFFSFISIFQHWKSAFLKFGEQANIVVFLERQSEQDTKEKILNSICKEGFIQSCEYRSVEKAQEIFLADYPELKPTVDQLRGDPFLASVHLRFKADEYQGVRMAVVSSRLKSLDGVEHVEDGQAWASLWEKSISILTQVFLISGFALGLATLFLLFSTVSIVIHHRKNEIEILNLVGATHFTISLPFVVQAVLQVFLGLSVSLALIYFAIREIKSYVHQNFGQNFFQDLQFFTWDQVALLFSVAAAFGALGAFMAVRRHLRET